MSPLLDTRANTLLFGFPNRNVYSSIVMTSDDNLLPAGGSPPREIPALNDPDLRRTGSVPPLPDQTDDHGYRLAEYQALRATIRQRGTARMVLVPAALTVWAALAIGTAAVITVALSTLIPLLALVAAFEGVFALHVNVERIGRYLQVFHERAHTGWEHVAMEFGRRFPGASSDPLFGRVFIFATSVNFFPAALGGEPWEAAIVAVCHFAFIYRVRKAQSLAAAIRAEDLRRFQAVLAAAPGDATPAGQSSSHERPIS
jgi:hypothetical protein